MIDLTDRQKQILKTIVEEYIDTAMPVGSETLDKKHNLGVSPATIRNEMGKLTKLCLLAQPHTSAGRIPTSTALKFYINQLMEEKELSVADEVSVKEKIWDYKDQLEKLLHEAVRVLANKTNSLAVSATDKGHLYHAGYANILDVPEFFDIDVTKTVLSIIDDFNQLNKFFQKSFGEEDIHILMGDEFGMPFLKPCGMVFIKFETKDKIHGSLGVIGPCRLNYPFIVPTVRYFGNLIQDIINSW